MTPVSAPQVRLGFVGAEHPHFRWLLASALLCPTAEVVGMSIGDAELRAHFAVVNPGIPAFATAEELYAEVAPEAIVTCADNRRTTEVVLDAARRGVHVMKEKPMATDLQSAERMIAAAERHGIRLMVNWKTNWSPAMHEAKRLADAGEIGRVLGIYHRAGHNGPPGDYAARGPIDRVGWGWLVDRDANGGGAMVDFCCYGAVISRWFMGQPAHVVAHGGRYAKEHLAVEDNGVIILGYPRGQSVVEATWTQPAFPVRLPTMVYGETGVIAVTGDHELRVATADPTGKPTQPREVSAPPLPAHHRSGPDHFTYALLHDLPFEGIVSPALARDAQEIVDAGLRSMAWGCRVELPLKAS
jgi:predicted dehydrogenase